MAKAEQKQSEFPAYKPQSVASLVPYARNSRTHSVQQVDKIAASIREFGFLNPVIVDGQQGIIAGHGRVLAAQKLGLAEVPTIEASHLTDAQRRAYVIADNRLALDAGWDVGMLKVEFQDLGSEGFDLTLTGFDLGEIADMFAPVAPDLEGTKGENYSRKIEAPIYRITGAMPKPAQLYSRAKADTLAAEIKSAKLPKEVQEFLLAAAERHVVFNFRNIAEFYAHSDAETQDLMERSALVIIDFDKAVENGFVQMSEAMMEQAELSKAQNYAG